MLSLFPVRNWIRNSAAAFALCAMFVALSGCSASNASRVSAPAAGVQARPALPAASKVHPFSFAHYTMLAPPRQGAGWVSSNR
jgi:hypothetical protein